MNAYMAILKESISLAYAMVNICTNYASTNVQCVVESWI